MEKAVLSSGSSHTRSPTQNSSGVITIVHLPMHVPHSKYHAYHNERCIVQKNTIRKMITQNHPQSSALHFNFFFFSLKA